MQVTALWRYPVKSMGGERLTEAAIGEFGLSGDRTWGVIDGQTGRVLTARREPRLLFASARLEGDNLVVTLPGATETDRSEDIARWLGRDVALQRARAEGGVYENPLDAEREVDWITWQGPGHAWHDSKRARLTLVSTATLGRWDARRFRPNVVLDGSGEDGLVGRRVSLGTALLDVTKRIDRCVMVARAQPGLPTALPILRAVNRERDRYVGIGALVAASGYVRVSDAVAVAHDQTGAGSVSSCRP